MADTHRDPVDHFRTTLPHAGETFIDAYCWPGLVSIALGVMSLAGCLAAVAYQHTEWVPTTGIVGLLATAGGIAWLVVEHNRVLRLESHWGAMHRNERPDKPIILSPTPEPMPERVLLPTTDAEHPLNHALLRLDRRAL
ncbi:protein UsfY [Mycobacterium sp.]|uniref:protein UsfY n=1 Tax=Mycobacterium sp. TaxID=1785 RepID=UPI003D6B570E